MERIYGMKRDLLITAVMVSLLVAALLVSPREASAQTPASTDQYTNASADQYQDGSNQTMPAGPSDPAYPGLGNQQPNQQPSQTETSQVAVDPAVSGSSGSDDQAQIRFYQAAIPLLQNIIRLKTHLQQSQAAPSGENGCDVYSFGQEVPDPATGTCYDPADTLVVGPSNPTFPTLLLGPVWNAINPGTSGCAIWIVDDCGDSDGDGGFVTDAHPGSYDTDPTDNDVDGSTFSDQDESDPNVE